MQIGISEEPYSPPGLILKDSDTDDKHDNSQDLFKEEEDNGDHGDGNHGNGYPPGDFPLSPPVLEPPKRLVNEKYESSNSSDEELSVLPTANVDNEPAKSITPPPLVTIDTAPKKPRVPHHCEDDDDDVFLPSPSPQAATPCKDRSNVEGDKSNSLPVNDESLPDADNKPGPLATNTNDSNKASSMVIGRRGRAAGKVLDESKLSIPLERGWQRIVRTRAAEGNAAPRVDICYVTPCNRRLRTFPEIQRYLQSKEITDLTVDHFTFSKKVKVGIVIDEQFRAENLENKLVQPRRGRPPKRAMAPSKQEEDHESSSRISLEPHEVMINHHPSPSITASSIVTDTAGTPHLTTITVPPTYPYSVHFSIEEPHTITTVVNELASNSAHVMTSSSNLAESDHMTGPSSHVIDPPSHMTDPPSHMTGSSIDAFTPSTHMISSSSTHADSSFDHMTDHMTTQPSHMTVLQPGHNTTSSLPQAVPPLLSGNNPNITTTTNTNNASDSNSGDKRSRGRPKGNKAKSSSVNNNIVKTNDRKGRKPKHVTHIAPSVISSFAQPPSLPHEEHNITTNDTCEASAVTRVIKTNKDKKRQIIQANKVRKKAESTRQQQTQRQRERLLLKQAKENKEKINKIKEAEWHQLRKSRLAKQKHAQNQIKARQRTLKLLEEIKQKEEERDRIMRIRQLEMQKAEQLRKPTEDLLVNDLVFLPPLAKLDWITIPSKSFAELVMVFEFCHSFEEFLELELVPGFSEVYRGLFNGEIKTSNNEDETPLGNGVMTLLVHLVKAVIHDSGPKIYTTSGQSVRDIEVKDDTVSELLRLYLKNRQNKTFKQVKHNHITHSNITPITDMQYPG
jgi:hypothetical protein